MSECVSSLAGIGKANTQYLNNNGIYSVQQLLEGCRARNNDPNACISYLRSVGVSRNDYASSCFASLMQRESQQNLRFNNSSASSYGQQESPQIRQTNCSNQQTETSATKSNGQNNFELDQKAMLQGLKDLQIKYDMSEVHFKEHQKTLLHQLTGLRKLYDEHRHQSEEEHKTQLDKCQHLQKLLNEGHFISITERKALHQLLLNTQASIHASHHQSEAKHKTLAEQLYELQHKSNMRMDMLLTDMESVKSQQFKFDEKLTEISFNISLNMESLDESIKKANEKLDQQDPKVSANTTMVLDFLQTMAGSLRYSDNKLDDILSQLMDLKQRSQYFEEKLNAVERLSTANLAKQENRNQYQMIFNVDKCVEILVLTVWLIVFAYLIHMYLVG